MPSDVPLELPPIMDSMAAGKLKDCLLARRGADLTVTGAGVERTGALCLQVLVAAQSLWRREGFEFEVVDASPSLADAARLTGLASILNIGFPEQ